MRQELFCKPSVWMRHKQKTRTLLPLAPSSLGPFFSKHRHSLTLLKFCRCCCCGFLYVPGLQYNSTSTDAPVFVDLRLHYGCFFLSPAGLFFTEYRVLYLPLLLRISITLLCSYTPPPPPSPAMPKVLVQVSSDFSRLVLEEVLKVSNRPPTAMPCHAIARDYWE